jgi:hypothetical protein
MKAGIIYSQIWVVVPNCQHQMWKIRAGRFPEGSTADDCSRSVKISYGPSNKIVLKNCLPALFLSQLDAGPLELSLELE